MRLRTTFLWTLIASLTVAAVLGILTIIFDGFGRIGEQVIVTALLVGAFSITGLVSAIVLDRSRRVLGWIGLVSSMLSFVGWTMLTWSFWNSGWSDWEVLVRVSASATYGSVWAPTLGVLLIPRLDRRIGRIIRGLTIGAATALLIELLIFTFTEYDDEWYLKLIAITAILFSCGSVVTPIFALVELVKRRSVESTMTRAIHVGVECPRCGTSARIRTGSGVCPSCRLRIRVHVEEPRCHCGYALYGLRGESCPECGRAVPPDQRWRVADDDDSSAARSDTSEDR